MTIKTKTAEKRDIRNEKIKQLFINYIGLPGSMKSAVVARVSKECRTSVSTVSRIIKSPLSNQ